MPVYGKGRVRGRVRLGEKRQIFRVHRTVAGEKTTHTIKLPRSTGWGLECTPLQVVERVLGFRIRQHIRALTRKVKNPVIVDWGPAEGSAITDLAKDFPGARCYGFGDTIYEEWFDNEHVKFIHAPAIDFKKYFKDGSIDFMYSNSGLRFVAPVGEHLKSLGVRSPAKSKQEYILGLVPKLKIGGKLLTDYLSFSHFQRLSGVKRVDKSRKGVFRVFEFNGMRFRVENKRTHKDCVLITRLK